MGYVPQPDPPWVNDPEGRPDKSSDAFLAENASSKNTPAVILTEFANASTFDDLHALLGASDQEDVRAFAGNNMLSFDEIIATEQAEGRYVAGWMALRDWARRQPWAAAEAERMRLVIERRNANPIDYAALGVRIRQQGFLLGQLKILRMRAETDTEREELTARILRLEKEFEEENFGARG